MATTRIRDKPADYFCKAGRIAQKLGRWTDSETAFLDTLRVDKTFSLAMVVLGSLFFGKDRWRSFDKCTTGESVA
jgi:hypothetical protein